MSGDLVQVDSDGKVRVKNDGVVVAGSGDGCCCDAACDSCDEVPESLLVNFTGTVCSPCFEYGGFWYKSEITLNPFPVEIPFVSNCQWEATAGTWRQKRYATEADCLSDNPVETLSGALLIQVTSVSATQFVGFIVADTLDPLGLLFTGFVDKAAPNDCMTEVAGDNESTFCEDAQNIATGGQMIISGVVV